MIAAPRISQTGAFTPSAGKMVFRLVSEPSAEQRRGTVVVVPPFAEELNKTRHVTARLARELATSGWRVVQRDLPGCGDSEGEFEHASWTDWLDDVAGEAADVAVGESLWLVGIRAGALLACAAIERRPTANLLLWHPVLSGAQHLQQFLRLHTGARLIGSAQPDTGSPGQLLRSGQSVELGGYLINPQLAAGLREATFRLPPEFGGRVVWFDMAQEATAPTPMPTSQAIEQLRTQGVSVTHAVVQGQQFWQTQELESSESLLERSVVSLQSEPHRHGEVVARNDGFRAPLRVDPLSCMRATEEPLWFDCEGARLLGILSRPPATVKARPLAVVIAVGGPQYRIGSHRQFVQLARSLAQSGYSVLRFDYRGMGDSQGQRSTFSHVEPDLRAAVDAVSRACPVTDGVVIWGLCDAASAALMFGPSNARVRGLVIANPWVRSDISLAVATVKHYYTARLFEADFWRKVLRGRLNWSDSMRSLRRHLRTALASRSVGTTDEQTSSHFQSRMAQGLRRLRGRVLLINSGNDLTAKEFLDHASSAPDWRHLLSDDKVSRVDIADADHTFSRRVWMDRVIAETIAWLHAFDSPTLVTESPAVQTVDHMTCAAAPTASHQSQ